MAESLSDVPERRRCRFSGLGFDSQHLPFDGRPHPPREWLRAGPQAWRRHLARVRPPARQDALGHRLLHQDGVDAPGTDHVLRAVLHSCSHAARAHRWHDRHSRRSVDGPAGPEHENVLRRATGRIWANSHHPRSRQQTHRAVLCDPRIRRHRIPAESGAKSNMNPFTEAWAGRTRREVLKHFIVFGEKHLRYVLNEWTAYHHTARPHQELGNVPISSSLPPPEPAESFRLEDVVCRESLGRLLKRTSARQRRCLHEIEDEASHDAPP
jgi:hypothetical protein